MFILKETIAKERQDIRKDMELERLRVELNDEKGYRQQLNALRDQVSQLQADLKIAKAETVKAKAEAKSEYAEHVMLVTDERVKEMKSVYDGFAKNLVEVIKAANVSAPAPVVIAGGTSPCNR